MSFVGGTCLKVYPHEGLTGYWYVTLPDYEELMFLRRYLCEEDVVYDVGANAGAYAVFAVGCGANVIAFEPVPQAFRRLRENVELNSAVGPITTLNCAVGGEAGRLRMTTGLGTGNHMLRSGESVPSVEVAVVTLDEVVRNHPMPTFLKVDVEGHELEVLKGANRILESTGLEGLLLETFRPHNWQKPKLQEIERILSSHGFLPFAYDAEINQIMALNEPDAGENNTFYFRSPDKIAERLKRKAV